MLTAVFARDVHAQETRPRSNRLPLRTAPLTGPLSRLPQVRSRCPLQLAVAPPVGLGRARALASAASAAGLAPPPPPLAADLASSFHGFVASDLAAVCEEARLLALQRPPPHGEEGSEEGGAGEGAPLLAVTAEEWRAAARLVEPASLLGLGTARESLGGARWRDVGGLARTKAPPPAVE